MFGRPSLIALALAIALVAGLAATRTPVSHGSRSQQARAAEGTPSISGSVRSGPAPARRDRASLDTFSLVAPRAITFEPPSRTPLDLEVIAVATAVPARHVVPSRSRGPPAA